MEQAAYFSRLNFSMQRTENHNIPLKAGVEVLEQTKQKFKKSESSTEKV